VGLCHSVQGTSRQIASYLGIAYDEMTWECAGINHNAWFTRLERGGEDLYPRLRECARETAIYERDPIRFEVMLHLGAFVTESSGHFSEYVPYFRKRPDLVKKYTRPGYLGETGFYANNWPRWRRENDESIEAMLAGQRPIPLQRSLEYGADIVEAVEGGTPARIHGNVSNKGAIANLPDGCVEVECLVDRGGIKTQLFGSLPEQLAALNRVHMAVHELVVEALMKRDRSKAKYALMLDPLTAAVCSPEEIDRLFEEMWAAERESLRAFD
jgi:alpha-galactosidase